MGDGQRLEQPVRSADVVEHDWHRVMAMGQVEVDLGIPGLGPGLLVGGGGFGKVYRATQLATGGPVAVKVFSGHLDDTARSRFEREAAALGSLRGHPNICTVFDAGVDGSGRPYLVMEYAPSTLAQRVADGPLGWVDATSLGVRIAGALETAHRTGLLHRDVKPENVLWTEFGAWLLADFGLARFTDDTASRTLAATVSHAAPELVAGGAASVASDVYALGSTLFTALTGRMAFARGEDEHRLSVYRRIEEEPVPAMSGVPEPVAAVVRQAMAKRPGDRFASAAALGETLQEAQRTLGSAVTPLPVRVPEPEAAPGPPLEPAASTVDDRTPKMPADPTEVVIRRDRERPPRDTEPSPEPAPQRFPEAPRRFSRRALVLFGTGVVAAVLVSLLAISLTRSGPRDETAPPVEAPLLAPSDLSVDTHPFSVLLAWSQPAGSGEVDHWIIYRNGSPIGERIVQSFEDDGVLPGEEYTYEVRAVDADGTKSAASTAFTSTPVPPKSEARLMGDFEVTARVTSSRGVDFSEGKVFHHSWSFSPKCRAGPCNVAWRATAYQQIRTVLKRSGAEYSGDDRGHMGFTCAGGNIRSHVILRIIVERADAVRGEWVATRIRGKLIQEVPAQRTCGRSTATYRVRGKVARS